MSVRIHPSIIAADYLALGAAVAAVERGGADAIHVDVMDGRFVPNLTVGPGIVEALRRSTTLPLDVHLMIEEPERYLEVFAKAGANVLTVHVEATKHLHRTIQAIKAFNLRAGVALNPATPVGVLEEIAGDVDVVLVMSVNPGFSWQTFIPRSVSKTAAVRALLDRAGSKADIELDGGVDAQNISLLTAAGATLFVAGAGVFGNADPAEAVRTLRAAAALPVGRNA
ncbi:MAG TPA: ribulose-phosphate 3-epimerase [Vicinamibacterales bacterium]